MDIDDKHYNNATASPDSQPLDEDLPDKDAQAGLQKVEAITSVWSKNSLILAYVS